MVVELLGELEFAVRGAFQEDIPENDSTELGVFIRQRRRVDFEQSEQGKDRNRWYGEPFAPKFVKI